MGKRTFIKDALEMEKNVREINACLDEIKTKYADSSRPPLRLNMYVEYRIDLISIDHVNNVVEKLADSNIPTEIQTNIKNKLFETISTNFIIPVVDYYQYNKKTIELNLLIQKM